MIKINSIKDVYSAVKEIIEILESSNENVYSKILRHRLFEVSWTTSSELYLELCNILSELIVNTTVEIDKKIVEQSKEIVNCLKENGL